MIAWWDGDGLAQDLFNNSPGSAEGGASFQDARVGQGFFLDGNDDRIKISNSTALNPSAQITIDAWINLSLPDPDRPKGEQSIVSKFNHFSSGADDSFYLGLNNPKSIRWQVDTGVDQVTDNILDVPLPSSIAGSFHHIAVTYDNAAMKVYIDGNLVGEKAATGPIRETNTDMFIGATLSTGNLARTFWGIIDEVEVYQRALPQAEIKSIFDAGSNGKCKESVTSPDGGNQPTECSDEVMNEKHNQFNFLGPETARGPAKDGGLFRNYNEQIPNASIYCHPDIGAHLVLGGILEKWKERGLETGALGYPITDQESFSTPDGLGGNYNNFQNGVICWANFAYVIIGGHGPQSCLDDLPVDGRATKDGGTNPSNLCNEHYFQELANIGLIPTPFTYEEFFAAFTQTNTPGWLYVNPNQKFIDVVGTVEKVEMAHQDAPANHYSHDHNTFIAVDQGYNKFLSRQPERDGILGTEWEIGTWVGEKAIVDAYQRGLPNWAWPSAGDRVWVNGHWVFDCGEPRKGGYSTEVHPIRAIAAMRDQLHVLPGSGSTPVRVTATDLYIHGWAGPLVIGLNCSIEFIIGNFGRCPEPDEVQSYDNYTLTPIDENFEFDIAPPPMPEQNSILVAYWDQLPCDPSIGGYDRLPPRFITMKDFRNEGFSRVGRWDGKCITDIAPRLDLVPADDPNSGSPVKVHVTIPLKGSGAKPTDAYARKIYVGWLSPSDNLRHFSLKLNNFVLHNTMETARVCECTFFWMNVNRAAGSNSSTINKEWIRFVDHALPNGMGNHVEKMDNLDDEAGEDNICDNDNTICFLDAIFDYYVVNGMTVDVEAQGYDQDCLDDDEDPLFDRELDLQKFGECFGIDIGSFDPTDVFNLPGIELENGDNDKYAELHTSLGPHNNYGLDDQCCDVAAGLSYPPVWKLDKSTFITQQTIASHLPGDHYFVSTAPQGVAVDSRGNLHVVDQACDRGRSFGFLGCFPLPRILVFNQNGDFIKKLDIPDPFARPTAISINRNDDTVYVADPAREQIHKFDSGGNHRSWEVGGGLQGIALDSSGNLYAVRQIGLGSLIVIFDRDGNFIKQFSVGGRLLSSIGVDSKNNIYVVDQVCDDEYPPFPQVAECEIELGEPHILKFNSDGQQIGILEPRNPNFSPGYQYLGGIAVGSNDQIYVVQQYCKHPFPSIVCNAAEQSSVLVFNENEQIKSTDLSYLTPGLTNIALDPDNNLYVVDGRPWAPPQYRVLFDVTEHPTRGAGASNEDVATLNLKDSCAPSSAFSANCTIRVNNDGPGLPRHVEVNIDLNTTIDNPEDYTITNPTFTVNMPDGVLSNVNAIPQSNCEPLAEENTPVGQPKKLRCIIHTIPVSGSAIIHFNIASRVAGMFDINAAVNTQSTDSPQDNSDHIRLVLPSTDSSPNPQITTPRDGAQFFTGQTITFKGVAQDQEDGDLTGSSLQWHSNRDGPLGTGNEISVVLSGPPTPCMPEFIGHTITLTATDSDGNSSTKDIVVSVGTVC
jgi:hypothetical protein